jgi:hypothetical protein
MSAANSRSLSRISRRPTQARPETCIGLGAVLLLGTSLATVDPVPPAAAEPSVYPTGTTRYDPARAYNSYVLFTGGDNVAHLIDLDGNSVHEWKDAGFFSSLLDPTLTLGRKGHVLLTLEAVEGTGTDLVPGVVTSRISKTIGEVDWDGKPVWTFGEKAPGGLARQHHDWSRLPNGNTLVLANLVHPVAGFEQPRLLDDVVYEVNPAGEIVWSWIASDHIEEFGFTPEELKLIREARTGDFFHINNMKQVGLNHWSEGGDARFESDNILIDSRNANVIAIISRKTGRVVWTLGPHYEQDPLKIRPRRDLPRPVDQISGQHDAHIIPEGLPGAGNLLVFDNQGEGGYPPVPLSVTGGSRVLEIDPVAKKIVWQYIGEDSGGPGWSFLSAHISSARRLPNGNTLIDEGERGRIFQVTQAGEIVWEYVSPYFRRTKDSVTSRETANNQVYRAQPVPYDWAPDGTPHAEKAIITPEISRYRVAGAP